MNSVYECATKCRLMCWGNMDLSLFKKMGSLKEFKGTDWHQWTMVLGGQILEMLGKGHKNSNNIFNW